jgi:hypothetical protein
MADRFFVELIFKAVKSGRMEKSGIVEFLGYIKII